MSNTWGKYGRTLTPQVARGKVQALLQRAADEGANRVDSVAQGERISTQVDA